MSAVSTPQGSFKGVGPGSPDPGRIHRINILKTKLWRRDVHLQGYKPGDPNRRPFCPKDARRALGEAVRNFKNDGDVSELQDALNALVGHTNNTDWLIKRLLSDVLDDAGLLLCPHCGAIEPRDGSRHIYRVDEVWCEGCVDTDAVWVDHVGSYACTEDTVYSETMQEYIMDSEAVGIYTSNSAVQNSETDDVVTRRYASNNLDYSDSLNAYYDGANVDNPDDDEDEDSGIIREYHSSKSNGAQVRLDSAADKRLLKAYVGCEIEVEVDGSYDRGGRAQVLHDALNSGPQIYAHFENDGSLDNGFEIVTNYCGWDRHAELLRPIQDRDLLVGLSSHDTETCGLHVHLSKQDITPFQATKIDQFFADPANTAHRDNFARRSVSESEYLDPISPRSLRALGEGWDRGHNWGRKKLLAMRQRRGNGKHYHIVNWSPSTTVEFRLFRGTLRYETILATLQFVQGLFWFTRECAPRAMNWHDLIAWARKPENVKDMRYFLRYCVERGITTPHQVDEEPQTPQPTKEPACA